MTSETFEIRVRNELWKRKMSAKQLAETLNISEAYLSDILKGKRNAPEQRKRIIYILSMDGDSNDI
ncbi:helix-turn-helix transcriptional regulator [Mycobacteroides abscessus]|uniref:helix-turn-helix domain-containing protein n=1 Tax=unclassified Desemzia TaxID=2685243 RepID=UPI0009A5721D